MRRRGEETDIGRMAAIHVGVGDAGEDAKILTVFLQYLQVRGRYIIAARPGGKKLIAEQPEVVTNTEHTAGLGARGKRRRRLRRLGEGRGHGIQERQRERNANSAKETPAVQRAPGGDMRSSHRPILQVY
jgi:hypothetical protein